MNTSKSFPHGYTNHFNSINVEGIGGYTKAMQHLYSYIAEVTKMRPENRYIDAVPLLDIISSTSKELSELLAEAEPHLTGKELEELLNFKLHETDSPR